MKKYLVIALCVVALAGGFLVFSRKNNNQAVVPETNKTVGETKKEEVQKGISVLEDVCSFFPKELIERAIGKPIVKQEKVLSFACGYYTSYSENYEHTLYNDLPGGPYITVVYEEVTPEEFARLRAFNESSGSRYENDPSIGMENYVMRNKKNEVWQVALVLDGNKYIRIKSVDDAVPGEDLIKIARVLAEQLTGDKSFNFEFSESQQAIVTNFFDNLFNQKIQEALALMDANQDTKQAWGVNFNTIESLKVNKIEEVNKDEWTPTRQIFKVELEVKVNPTGEEMGWQNGTNYRWVTLEKQTNGQWLIHELANNP